MIDRLHFICPICKLRAPVRSQRGDRGWSLFLEEHAARHELCPSSGRLLGFVALPLPGLQVRLHALLVPAPDAAGAGSESAPVIAHCLELDLRTAGPTPQAALRRLTEAIDVVCQESQADGGPALPLQAAPQEAWTRAAAAVPCCELVLSRPQVPSVVLVGLWSGPGAVYNEPALQPPFIRRAPVPPWIRRARR